MGRRRPRPSARLAAVDSPSLQRRAGASLLQLRCWLGPPLVLGSRALAPVLCLVVVPWRACGSIVPPTLGLQMRLCRHSPAWCAAPAVAAAAVAAAQDRSQAVLLGSQLLVLVQAALHRGSAEELPSAVRAVAAQWAAAQAVSALQAAAVVKGHRRPLKCGRRFPLRLQLVLLQEQELEPVAAAAPALGKGEAAPALQGLRALRPHQRWLLWRRRKARMLCHLGYRWG